MNLTSHNNNIYVIYRITRHGCLYHISSMSFPQMSVYNTEAVGGLDNSYR